MIAVTLLMTLTSTPGIKQDEEKTRYLVQISRNQPQRYGYLLLVDTAFSLKCGRTLKLNELKYLETSHQFDTLIANSIQGVTAVNTLFKAEFEKLPCKG